MKKFINTQPFQNIIITREQLNRAADAASPFTRESLVQLLTFPLGLN